MNSVLLSVLHFEVSGGTIGIISVLLNKRRRRKFFMTVPRLLHSRNLVAGRFVQLTLRIQALLIPVFIYKDHLQWYLIPFQETNRDEDIGNVLRSEEYPSALAPIKELDWTSMYSKRHFLGFCPEAEITLGSSKAPYGDIKDSCAPIEKSTVRLKGFSASLGTEGMSVFVSCLASFLLSA